MKTKNIRVRDAIHMLRHTELSFTICMNGREIDLEPSDYTVIFSNAFGEFLNLYVTMIEKITDDYYHVICSDTPEAFEEAS